jgi:hypothetical protein
VRMRVASSDWWASRMVVSVMSTRFSLRIHSAKLGGPAFEAAGAVRHGAIGEPRIGLRRGPAGGRGPGFRMAVDGDVGDPAEQLGGAVLRLTCRTAPASRR